MNLVPDMKLLCSPGAFFLLAARSAVEPADFPFYKDISLPQAHPELVSTFNIDAEMYQTLENMNGFRIYSPDGTSCPFLCDWAMAVDSGKPVRRDVEATIERFETLSDGSVRITVSVADGDRSELVPSPDTAPVTGLRIRTSAKDFDKKVKVYTPDHGNDKLVAEGAFLDYSSRIDLRNDYIAFPEAVGANVFVVVIENYTETKDSPLSRVVQGDTNIVEQYKVREEPKITGISLTRISRNFELDKVRSEIPVAILSRELRGQTTIVKFSNGFAPLGELKIRSSDAFFSRQYRLYDDSGTLVRYGAVRWLECGSYRTSESDCVIDVLDKRSKSWTLELDNGDNGELKDIKLTASGPVHQVRFLSKTPIYDTETVEKSDGRLFPSYRVYYGAVDLPEPENPFADMIQSSQTAARGSGTGKEYKPDCTLSPQQSNPAFRTPSGLSRNWGVVYRILMAAAALAVLVILIVSVKGVEKIKE